jgi:hypothetical protein
LSRWVRIYHDYPLFEFTVQILREPHIEEIPEAGRPTLGESP